MNRFEDKLKSISKGELFQIVMVLLFPVLLSICVCALRGIDFFALYTPASHNNDSLFYYKLVDGILAPGGMKGYFGYNESHSAVGGYAAWNPAVLLPWILFGRVFGWNYFSPILYNIIVFSVALALFVRSSEMNWKQSITMFLVLGLYPSFTIHLLSVLPEINIASFVLLFLSCIFGWMNRRKEGYLVAALICCVYLTLCRPYLFILFIIPTVYFVKSGRKHKWWYPFSGMVIAVVLYVLTTKYMTAAYFKDMIDFSIVKYVLQGDIVAAFATASEYIKIMFVGVKEYVWAAFHYGLTAGTQYFVAWMAAGLLVLAAVEKKNKEKRIVFLILSASFLCVFLAVVFLMHLVNEGGRHCFVFSVVLLILLCVSEFDGAYCARQTVVVAFLLIFACKGAYIPTDYDIPARDANVQENIEYLSAVFDEYGMLNPNAEGYENTVIWTLVDTVGDAFVKTDYQSLYAIPSSMGISCCTTEYVVDNINHLKSKYIAIPAGGTIESLLIEKGCEELVRTEATVFYELY